MNIWGIPDWLEREVRERDKKCVYCGIQMIVRMPREGPRKNVATWEHIINDARIVTRENIARCCVACNSSKGVKSLSDWIPSSYCKKRGINKDTVSEVVKQALQTAMRKDA
ncbi:MAG: HNH endonuclease [Bacteroidota bacterium]